MARREADGGVWLSGPDLDFYLNGIRTYRDKQRKEAQAARVAQPTPELQEAPQHQDRVNFFLHGGNYPGRPVHVYPMRNPNRGARGKRKSA